MAAADEVAESDVTVVGIRSMLPGRAEPDFLRRTRLSYDALADDYAEWIRHELAAEPLDRALLAGFAELVLVAGGGPVADIGCGPGRITAHLNDLGLSVFGIDLSPGMVASPVAHIRACTSMRGR